MTVYKRGEFYWYDFWFDGQRFRKSTKLVNKTAALRAESIRRAELAEGRAGIVRRELSPKFEDFAIEFLTWSKAQHREHPKTYLSHKTSVDSLLRDFGGKRLDEINTWTVEQFKVDRSKAVRQNSRKGDLVRPATVNRELACLSLVFNLAVAGHKAASNPVRGVKRLFENNGRMRVLSFEEERAYLSKASQPLRDVATVMLGTGMRPGEVYAISKEDVNLAEHTVFVSKGKTRFAIRKLPLPTETFDVIKKRYKAASDGWLFPSRKDPSKPLASVRKAHDLAVVQAGFNPPPKLYDLRHTALSRMAMAGVDLATLREIAGHADVRMTMRYLHPTEAHKREAVKKFEEYRVRKVFEMVESELQSPQLSPQ